jgi:uncharacterized SAM-binding protein YcdF (DUF218 family)
MPISERERFTAVLNAAPLYAGDAIVVLCGQDITPRLRTAATLLARGAAPQIVVTGGTEEPPRVVGALAAERRLWGMGVAAERILVEPFATNTAEQARNVLRLVVAQAWKRLLLVASPYHEARAFLTFLRAAQTISRTDLHLQMVPAERTKWWEAPEGMTMTRLELLAVEYEKIEAYAADVAPYMEGLVYLRHWEGTP